MEKFTIEEGSLIVINNPRQNLNLIYPPAFIKQAEVGNFQQFIFYHQRFFPGLPRKKRPDFIINRIENQKLTADFLLVGPDFGLDDDELSGLAIITALKALAIRVLIGVNFGANFKANAFKKGILIIELQREDWQALITWHQAQIRVNPLIKIDLTTSHIHFNQQAVNFSLTEQIQKQFLKGEDQISYSLKFLDEIKAYEANLPYTENK